MLFYIFPDTKASKNMKAPGKVYVGGLFLNFFADASFSSENFYWHFSWLFATLLRVGKSKKSCSISCHTKCTISFSTYILGLWFLNKVYKIKLLSYCKWVSEQLYFIWELSCVFPWPPERVRFLMLMTPLHYLCSTNSSFFGYTIRKSILSSSLRWHKPRHCLWFTQLVQLFLIESCNPHRFDLQEQGRFCWWHTTLSSWWIKEFLDNM